MDDRIHLPVALPSPNPTTSYWQTAPLASAADLAFAQHRSTPTLPATTDYLIIGGGITGACIARNLLLKRPGGGGGGARVLLLEARTAASGATGRNGGHTKAASYRSFRSHARAHGVAEAVRIARLEKANIDATHARARAQGAQMGSATAATPGNTLDVIFGEKEWREARAAVEMMREAMGEEDPVAEYKEWTPEELEERLGIKGAVGGLEYAAGSISAFGFAIGVLRLAVEAGLNLQTETPVTGIRRAQQDETTATSGARTPEWIVETPRGTVTASNVILATNGYTAHLLPQVHSKLVPLHGQVVAQRPGSGLPQTGLDATISFIHPDGGAYEYMITRPPGSIAEGDIIIGGGIGVLPDLAASRFGNTDDTTLEPNIQKYLRQCTADYFGERWGDDHPDGRIKHEWSGIMGATADGLPYVGAVPDQPGLWIAAGFNGHGMVWCLKSAEALVEMMAGDAAELQALEEWFPKAARISKERLCVKFTGGDWQDAEAE